MSAGQFRGVPLEALFERVRPLASSVALRVDGDDTHSAPSAGGRSTLGASWVLSLDQVAQTGSFLATHVGGEPLAADHGRPLRLVNPGWYGCSCIKWVRSVAWVDEREPSTGQMIEFSSRTHQVGEPLLARDYAAPEIQQAAMPVRVEKRRGGAGIYYRVVGILWGGQRPVRALELSVDGGQSYQRVALCPPVWQNRTWRLWTHDFQPARSGRHELLCRVDADLPMRRLDSRYYLRSVLVDEIG